MGPLSNSPYSQLRQDASSSMLGLNDTLFQRGLQYRQGLNERARRDRQRDQKYAAFGAGAGGLANILSMIPGQPPPAQIPGYNIGAGGNVTLQGGYGGAPPDDEIRRMLRRG